jgi:hypothetical protein
MLLKEQVSKAQVRFRVAPNKLLRECAIKALGAL